MTPEALATIHARCFRAVPRAWTAREFTDLLGLSSTFAITRPEGFAIGSVAGPEGELLTLAVDPAVRRRGIARALLSDLEDRMATHCVEEIFLEVATTNDPARALYCACGFTQVGCRRGYYTSPGVPAIDALVFSKRIAPADSPARAPLDR